MMYYLLTQAIKAAMYEVKCLILRYFQIGVEGQIKADKTFFSIADLQGEEILRKLIEKAVEAVGGKVRFFGEEAGKFVGPEDAEFTAIVDPIDGSALFINGINLFGICVILFKGQEVVFAGVIMSAMDLHFFLDESGPILNNEPLEIPKPEPITNGSYLGVSSDGHHWDFRPDRYPGKIRAFGCTAYHALAVAIGAMQGALLTRYRYYDAIAALAICQAAGLSIVYYESGETVKLSDLRDKPTCSQPILICYADKVSEWRNFGFFKREFTPPEQQPKIRVAAGVNFSLEITAEYDGAPSETKVIANKIQIVPASGPLNIIRSIKQLDRNRDEIDAHMFAITGPSCPDSYPIEAHVVQGLVEDIKNQGITPHTYPWRERLAVSVNPLPRGRAGICIRYKPEYELNNDRRSEIRGDIQQVLPGSSQQRDWLILASIGLQDVDLVQTILEETTGRLKSLLILSLDLIQSSDQRNEVSEMIGHVDFLIQNEEEIKQLCPKLEKTDALKDKKEWVKSLKDLGCKNIIVTRGTEGVVALKHGEDEWIHQPAFQVKAVDSVGAGDAFTGGFIFAQSCGKGFQESLRWGLATAAVQVQVVGGKPQISREKVKGILGSGS